MTGVQAEPQQQQSAQPPLNVLILPTIREFMATAGAQCSIWANGYKAGLACVVIPPCQHTMAAGSVPLTMLQRIGPSRIQTLSISMQVQPAWMPASFFLST
jgi:hypothetical protein